MHKFISFSTNINNYTLPKKFNYPYNYTPHPIAKTAVKELQSYLKNQTDFDHNFGIKEDKSTAIGKMFGVLVVKNHNHEIGYIAAFSGKLADKTIHKHFVPPVFDVLDKEGIYLKTEEELNTINQKVQLLEEDAVFINLKFDYFTTHENHLELIKTEQNKLNTRRKNRKLQNKKNNQLNINEEFYIREYQNYLDDKIAPLKNEYICYQNKIDNLKRERKQKSAWVQQQIFKQYQFLNYKGQTADLLSIFNNTSVNIPAGAGDCCAPKLLQYAFLNNLTPIAMAEFWWGKSLEGAVRKHNYFYPACNGKCKPILTHMLKGILVEENPLIIKLQKTTELSIVYEDESIAVVNKPYNLLSVEGKEIEDSVYLRIQKKYPNATGPLLVHRLDMSTSGILLIAKNKEAHKHIQAQFINKTIKKTYTALLNGVLNEKKGTINLPLRVDLTDRPKQLVCYKHGKKALTHWEVIQIEKNITRVLFYPITGRTHQLRVHAAHMNGLNTPIIGDDLYGKEDTRLYLHATSIQFIHPINLKEMVFTIDAPF